MRRILARSLCLTLFLSLAGFAISDAQTRVSASFSSPGTQIDISYFYDNLASDGEWVQEPTYGWCWTPYDMGPNWRPYYNGHWEYTDYGWSWASNERWGWATYHYGRWLFDDNYGWVWVPGTDWAPAWVAWRYGDDWVGWAPLPPSAGWGGSGGLVFASADEIPSDDWCFVPQRHLLDVDLRVQVTLVARNVSLISRSRDVTRFAVRDGRPANFGIDVAEIEKVYSRPVPRVRIVDAETPDRGRGEAAGKGAVAYYRPAVRPASPDQAPPPAITERRNAIPDAEVQRLRDQQQRKLDSDLKAERARLDREQKAELAAKTAQANAEELRQRHAAEQKAFDAHAAQQRRVLDQRLQKKIVKPGKTKDAGKPAKQDKNKPQDQGSGQDKGQGQGQGQGQDKGQGQGQDKGGK